MKVIGVTGGMGTGKSTVAKMFERLGAQVLDADQITHQLLRPETQVTRKIRKEFGAQVFAGSRLNKKRLAKTVFSDKAKLKKLTGIIHPAVRRKIVQQAQRMGRRNPKAVVVMDIPLLIEAGHYKTDALVEVAAPLKTSAGRLKKRSGFSAAEVKRRSSFQMPLSKKKRRADFVVDNGGTLENTRRQVLEIWKQINEG